MQIPFFGRKARAPTARTWPDLLRTTWANAELPRSYEALARDAYCRNPIAQRAVRIIAESAAGAPVLATPAGHPALALLSGGEPGPALMETIAANLLLHGNAYVKVGLGAGGLPAGLFTLRPERVTVEVDDNGWPTEIGRAHV